MTMNEDQIPGAVREAGNTSAPALALASGHPAGAAQPAGRMGGEPATARGAVARRGHGSASQDRLDTEKA
ncbi:hypothetical protein [Paeniglutamicibacter sp. NPDC091659]|uniref:hypothetical protein n=1 Tax=Paeniglutamicibacter sp. NPDC091659 TaxID=3364389 RepID=UPI0038123EB7